MLTLYHPNQTRLTTIKPDDNSYRYRAIMGDHNLTLYFSLPQHLEIPVGAYLDFQGQRYTLHRPSDIKMHHTRHFDYTLILEADAAKAKMWRFRNPVDGRLRFTLTAKPREHLQMLVDNLNQREQGWSISECIDQPETTIAYDHVTCSDALAQMADVFKTEYEIIGRTISLRKVEYYKSNPLPLSYGRGNGFVTGVGRTNQGDAPPTDILFVQGGERNIDPSKYGSSTLHLPKSQTIKYDGERFENEDGFYPSSSAIYRVDDLGMSVKREGNDNAIPSESSVDLADIYPSRIGSVSNVVIVNEEKHFYDIVDASIPESLNYEECRIAGEKMTIIFQDGMLAGREFEIQKYDHQERRFEIVPQEIDGQTMPGGNFIPRKENKYIVLHCALPLSYVSDNATQTGAEWELLRAAVRHLYDNERPAFTFTGTLDAIWAKKNWDDLHLRLSLGSYILFSDPQFQPEDVAIRIVGIKDYLNNPHAPEIELSNTTISSSFTTRMQIIESREIIQEEGTRQTLEFTKRRFRDAQETMKALQGDLSEAITGFSSSINPITAQTMMMLVGDDSLQFSFVSAPTATSSATHNVTYDATTQRLYAAQGTIRHFTLGQPSQLAPVSTATSRYKHWQVQEYNSPPITEAQNRYYLYAICSPVENGQVGTAQFSLQTQPLKLLQGGNVNLLIGILNPEYDGARSFVQLYGFTEILPSRITTDRIVSANGSTYIDLATDAMKLGSKLSFENGVLTLDALFAENADIGGWVFRNGRLESQATTADGQPQAYLDGASGEMRLNGTLQLSTNFSPNLSDANIHYLPKLATGDTGGLLMITRTGRQDIGKILKLHNPSAAGGGYYEITLFRFTIIGSSSSAQYTSIFYILPGQTAEITCFETGRSSNGYSGEWILTNLFPNS